MNTCQLSDYSAIRVYGQWYGILQNELERWHRDYLPVHGTVLDIGAGCGETVYFYLAHGAQHVVAFESDPIAFSMLKANYGENPKVTILGRVDHIKIDIDGAEEGTLLETHWNHVWKDLGLLSQNGPIHLWRLEKA